MACTYCCHSRNRFYVSYVVSIADWYSVSYQAMCVLFLSLVFASFSIDIRHILTEGYYLFVATWRMAESEAPFFPREKLIEKQKYFQNIHKHTYLKGRMDKVTSVAIPLALAASSLFLIVSHFFSSVMLIFFVTEKRSFFARSPHMLLFMLFL